MQVTFKLYTVQSNHHDVAGNFMTHTTPLWYEIITPKTNLSSIWQKLSSLVPLPIVIMTTYGAISDHHVFKFTIFCFGDWFVGLCRLACIWNEPFFQQLCLHLCFGKHRDTDVLTKFYVWVVFSRTFQNWFSSAQTSTLLSINKYARSVNA